MTEDSDLTAKLRIGYAASGSDISGMINRKWAVNVKSARAGFIGADEGVRSWKKQDDIFVYSIMRFYLGVTDNNWFSYLNRISPDDVNFWQPGGATNFKVLSAGEPFLFKLKSPLNAIGGIGFFSSHTFMPINMAWEIFGNKNGCDSFMHFRQMNLQLRRDKAEINPSIGFIVLTSPIFFQPEDWIEISYSWNKNIVQGKSYDTEEATGRRVWERVERLLPKYHAGNIMAGDENPLILEEPGSPQYGKPFLQKPRLGQGAFRVLVTDAYQRKCSVSGEKTLPVLEAAHIKPIEGKFQ